MIIHKVEPSLLFVSGFALLAGFAILENDPKTRKTALAIMAVYGFLALIFNYPSA